MTYLIQSMTGEWLVLPSDQDFQWTKKKNLATRLNYDVLAKVCKQLSAQDYKYTIVEERQRIVLKPSPQKRRYGRKKTESVHLTLSRKTKLMAGWLGNGNVSKGVDESVTTTGNLAFPSKYIFFVDNCVLSEKDSPEVMIAVVNSFGHQVYILVEENDDSPVDGFALFDTYGTNVIVYGENGFSFFMEDDAGELVIKTLTNKFRKLSIYKIIEIVSPLVDDIGNMASVLVSLAAKREGSKYLFIDDKVYPDWLLATKIFRNNSLGVDD